MTLFKLALTTPYHCERSNEDEKNRLWDKSYNCIANQTIDRLNACFNKVFRTQIRFLLVCLYEIMSRTSRHQFSQNSLLRKIQIDANYHVNLSMIVDYSCRNVGFDDV